MTDDDIDRFVHAMNEKLLDFIKGETLDYARLLHDAGFSRDEINEILTRKLPQVEQWRAETLAEVVRIAVAPDAPSFELQ